MRRPDFEDQLTSGLMRSQVQKPSQETRLLQLSFEANVAAIKESPDLVTAVKVISAPQSASDFPWNGIDARRRLEMIENHAEALLSISSFVDAFEGWPGLDEIRNFCNDKKWWKRRLIPEDRRPSPPLKRRHPRRRIHISEEVFPEIHSKEESETASGDISQDELTAETPPDYHQTARKGTSVLRPRFSITGTPGTPTRPGDPESDSTDMATRSEREITDEEEIQLLQLPIDVSSHIQNESKVSRKRHIEDVDEGVERPRKTRMAEPAKPASFNFGRGRPPLTTVTVILLVYIWLISVTVDQRSQHDVPMSIPGVFVYSCMFIVLNCKG
jgi:hypothetical protein